MPIDMELEAVLRPMQYPMPPYPPKVIILANGKKMVIRQAALRKGLIADTQAAGLSNRGAMDLIFLPGFSPRAEAPVGAGTHEASRHLGGEVLPKIKLLAIRP